MKKQLCAPELSTPSGHFSQGIIANPGRMSLHLRNDRT